MPKSQKPRKKYRQKLRLQSARDPWPLEGEILAVTATLANDVATVRTFDILIPWLMLVHRVSKLRDDVSTGRVAEGAFRTCDEIVQRRILLPSVITSDDPGMQRIHVSSVEREALMNVLPTLIAYLRRAANTDITKAASQLMEEFQ